MFREHIDQDTKQKAEFDARRRQQEMEDRVARNIVDAEREHELELRKVDYYNTMYTYFRFILPTDISFDQYVRKNPNHAIFMLF